MSEEKDVFETISDQLVGLAGKIGTTFEAGRLAEYNDFWDAYQQNGNKTSYTYAFAKEGWNNGTFKPKHPIIAVGDASYMFDNCGLVDFDFVENGIEMDLSSATSLTYIFRECKGIKRLGVIDCNGCKNLNRLFYGCRVVTIDKFIVNENITYSNTFDYASALENITIEGVIGNSISFSDCKDLTKKSIINIIACLDTTEGRSATSITLSKTAVDNAFEGASNDDGFGNDEFNNICATARTNNWTISLI